MYKNSLSTYSLASALQAASFFASPLRRLPTNEQKRTEWIALTLCADIVVNTMNFPYWDGNSLFRSAMVTAQLPSNSGRQLGIPSKLARGVRSVETGGRNWARCAEREVGWCGKLNCWIKSRRTAIRRGKLLFGKRLRNFTFFYFQSRTAPHKLANLLL